MYLTARPRSNGGTKFKDFGSPEIFFWKFFLKSVRNST